MGRCESIPFFLGEAEISLWRAAADDSALLDEPVWFGCCANQLNLTQRFERVRIARSGARRRRTYHTDNEHTLEIGRVWLMRKGTLRDFTPVENERFVMQIRWHDRHEGVGYQRTYFGVTIEEYALSSRGVLQSDARQVWHAEYMEDGEC